MGRIEQLWVTERTAIEWKNLTGDQRSGWWDFAMDHPVTYENGNIKMLNGWQMFNYVNVQLALAAYNYLVMDPPTNLSPPDPIYFSFTLWNHKSKLNTGKSWYHHRLIINVETAIPEDRVIVFYQDNRVREPYTGRATQAPGNRARNQRQRRNTCLYPGESGQFDFGVTRGMAFNQSAYNAKRHPHGVKGIWKATHPTRPAGAYRVVSTLNGMFVQVEVEI